MTLLSNLSCQRSTSIQQISVRKLVFLHDNSLTPTCQCTCQARNEVKSVSIIQVRTEASWWVQWPVNPGSAANFFPPKVYFIVEYYRCPCFPFCLPPPIAHPVPGLHLSTVCIHGLWLICTSKSFHLFHSYHLHPSNPATVKMFSVPEFASILPICSSWSLDSIADRYEFIAILLFLFFIPPPPLLIKEDPLTFYVISVW